MSDAHVTFVAGMEEGAATSSSSSSIASDDGASPTPDGQPKGKKRRPSWSLPVSRSAKMLGKRASQMIIEVPITHLKKIHQSEKITPFQRETQHFVGVTGMHGMLRIYRSHGWATLLWTVLTAACGILLIWQSVQLILLYTGQPTVSQVSFLISESGLEFPKITICNFNPIRKTFIEKINMTHDFSPRLLRYLMQANNDVLAIYGNADPSSLVRDDVELKNYMNNHPSFSINEFFFHAGFSCEDVMKLCSFAGRQFDCCNYTTPVLTSLGRCHVMNLGDSTFQWMRRQTEEGVDSGLQIVLDAHLEEQVDVVASDSDPVFSNQFENGFRFYVSEPQTSTYRTSQGTSVSPGDRIYSALSAISYSLLDKNNWGNCTSEWPARFNSTSMKYSARDCSSKCKALFFIEKCGCSPFAYNIESQYRSCTPLETYNCVKENIVVNHNETTEEFVWPDCKECVIECDRWEYTGANSYGNGFSNAALKWLSHHDTNWTTPHIRANFLTVNVFFRDMSYTKYSQVQGTTFTEILSDIGGNMGMFLGMSVVTLFEAAIYLWKIFWIAISTKRRAYMLAKKKREEEHSRQTEETMKSFREMTAVNFGALAGMAAGLGHAKDASEVAAETANKASMATRVKTSITSHLGSMKRKAGRVHPFNARSSSIDEDRRARSISLSGPPSRDRSHTESHRFMERFYDRVLHGAGRADSIDSTSSSGSVDGSVIELKIDLNDLNRLREASLSNGNAVTELPTVVVNRKHTMHTRKATAERRDLDTGTLSDGDNRPARNRFTSEPPEVGMASSRSKSYDPASRRPRFVSFLEHPSVSQNSTEEDLQQMQRNQLDNVLNEFLDERSIP